MKIDRRIRYRPRVESTMLWAREEVEAGRAQAGTTFRAGAQTAGRGRHGRSFHSPPGRGLYLTLVLPPDFATPSVTLAGALAVAEGGERAAGIDARIKWPNDVLTDGRKWAGVLAELLGPVSKGPVLLGVGINANHTKEDLGADLATTATSLALASGAAVDDERLLGIVLDALERRLNDYAAGGFGSIRSAFERRSLFRPGDSLELRCDGAAPATATFRGLDDEGRLLIAETDEPVASATVRLLTPAR